MTNLLDDPNSMATPDEFVTDAKNENTSYNISGQAYAATSSMTSDPFSRRDQGLVRVEVGIQAAILAITVVGNVLVLLALAKRAVTRGRPVNYHRPGLAPDHGRAAVATIRSPATRCRLSRMDFMLVHLAVADLSVAFFNVLPQLVWDATGRFHGNDALCRTVAYLQVAAMYGSSYVLTATAVDRYLSICHPLRSFTWSRRRMLRVLIGAAWTASGILAAPQLIIWGYREMDASSKTYTCWAVFEPPWTLQVYMTWSTLVIYVIPLVALTTAYSRICVVVWQSSRANAFAQQEIEAVTAPDNSAISRPKDEAGLLRSMSTTAGTSCDESTETSTLTLRSGGGIRTRTAATRMVSSGRMLITSGVTGVERRPAISRAKVKTVKLTIAVVFSYLVCWFPYFMTQLWAVWDETAPFEGVVMTIASLLASLNSCMNPLIYFAFVGSGISCCSRRPTAASSAERRRRRQGGDEMKCSVRADEHQNGCV